MEQDYEVEEPGTSVRPRVLVMTAKVISRALLAVVTLLLAANLLILFLKFGLGHHYGHGLIEAFYFDGEANFPSLYSALGMLVAASLLIAIGRLPEEIVKGNRLRWWSIAMVFVFLAVDEFASVHEDLIAPTQALFGQLGIDPGFLYFGWFIPYTLAGLFIAAFLVRFFFGLPVPTRISFTIAGIVFLSGAVGMEMIGGKYWVSQGWSLDSANEIDITYALIATFEELLEMLGVVIFVHALSAYYLQRKRISLFLAVEDKA